MVRQFRFRETDIGKFKTKNTSQTIRDLNPGYRQKGLTMGKFFFDRLNLCYPEEDRPLEFDYMHLVSRNQRRIQCEVDAGYVVDQKSYAFACIGGARKIFTNRK